MAKKEKRLLFWRIVLGVLIVCNMAVVFLFSSQSGTKSAAVSQKVTANMVELIPKDYLDKVTEPPKQSGTTTPEITTNEKKPNQKEPQKELSKEQLALIKKWHTPIRKLAHMAEFGSLASLAFIFLLTWGGKILWRYAASLGFALVYAATDELHQLFRDGRGARLSDVAIDFAGAFIACTLALIVVMLVRRIKKSKTTDSSAEAQKPTLFARVSQIFSRFLSFVSDQISKFKQTNKENKEKEKEK